MRWCEEKEEGEILVGGNGKGNQLNCPMGLSFDDEGNLYVADYYNHRIEKFEIMLPALYALTSNRKRKTYEEMIRIIINLAASRGKGLAVNTIVSGYEDAW
ncbi:unnamed protein product [Adineta steineri]|uniref:Uncharacterized protein n=1 Tax=Adineta steineri TaxID=433720 RepID=A0A815HKU7_9BILA|nr:unnamed protein product [Adineta steineri]CAF4099162.1 unnamed protein product [Adineta steineri]